MAVGYDVRKCDKRRFDVVDATSPIRCAEYSIDAGPWTPLEAADGILDSRR